MGSSNLEGGAPNNFLLMRSDKLCAPFGSTVRKGWLNTDKEPEKLMHNTATSDEIMKLRQQA